MTDREELEGAIRTLLATEQHAVLLSNKLFSPPGGLFCRLAVGTTEVQRREIVSGELFRSAQRRIRELERSLVRRFRSVVAGVEESHPDQSLPNEALIPANI